MRYTFKLADEMIKVAPRSLEDPLVLSIDGRDYTVEFEHLKNGLCNLSLGGRTYQAWVARDGDDIHMKLAGRYFKVTAFDPRSLATSKSTGEGSVTAPMPGLAIELLVAEGQNVSEGDKLLTIESMKLQSTIYAPCAGVIDSIHVAPSVEFNKDDVLLVITPQSDEA